MNSEKETQPPEEKNSKLALLEAILFAYGAPIALEKLALALEAHEDEVKELVEELASRLENERRGLRLLQIGDHFQLGTAPEASQFIEKLFKKDFKEDLTPAALETLAIVAYRGPISRAEIDYIRGVNSSFILRSLLVRGLLSREPDKERPHLWRYFPSFEFLKLLGVTKPSELPEFASLSKKLEELTAASEPAGEAPIDAEPATPV